MSVLSVDLCTTLCRLNNDSQLLYVGGFNFATETLQRSLFSFSGIKDGWKQILVDIFEFAKLFNDYSDLFVQIPNEAFAFDWQLSVKVYIDKVE